MCVPFCHKSFGEIMSEDAVFDNRAESTGYAAENECEDCDEELLFAMQDNFHQFSLGLRTVLYCLRVAERRGHVPPLPDGWWAQTAMRHNMRDIFDYPHEE
jgi:hypothetical protein